MFSSWPEFKSSSFLDETNRFFEKMTDPTIAELNILDNVSELKSENGEKDYDVKENDFNDYFETLETIIDADSDVEEKT